MLQQKWGVHNTTIKEVSIKGTKETLVEAEVEGILEEEEEDLIICYNCNQPGHLAHDYQNPCMTCTYCRALDHSTEDCPQLVVKWQARGNQNQNLNQNVQMISTERHAMKDPE
jgi:hypothetical protein